MTKFRAIDMLLFDELFEMHDGYVLNYSERNLAQLFARSGITVFVNKTRRPL